MGDGSAGTAPGTPADHLRALLAVLLTFARDRISAEDDFYPFGATMLPDGELQAASSWDGDGTPTADEVLSVVRAGLRTRAERGEVLATGVVTAVMIEVAGFDRAIRIELEHRDAPPLTWVVPYRSDDDRYEEGEPVAVTAERHTWG